MRTIVKTSRSFISNNTEYRLTLVMQTSRYEPEPYPIVCVQRYWEDTCEWYGVPSGWNPDKVFGLRKLCIDGGQNWFVDIPAEAWDDIRS